MLVNVDWSHILRGGHSAYDCPVALAAEDAFVNAGIEVSGIGVTHTYMSFYKDGKEVIISYPPNIWEWISAYDSPSLEENIVEPISFEIDTETWRIV